MSQRNLMFADDNSAYRRAARREAAEQALRDRRRQEIVETLRRLREEATDDEARRARERAQRHADLLERYPPLPSSSPRASHASVPLSRRSAALRVGSQ